MLSYRQIFVLLVVCGVAMSQQLHRQKRQFQTPVTLPAGPGNFRPNFRPNNRPSNRPNNIVSTLDNPAAGQARGGGGGGGSFDDFFGTNFG